MSCPSHDGGVHRPLLIEDDPAIAEPLTRHRPATGTRVGVAGDGPTGLRDALAGGHDLLGLDLGQPGPGLVRGGEPPPGPSARPVGVLASDRSPSRQTSIAAATLVHVTQNNRPVERSMTDNRPLDRQVPLVWLAVAGFSTVALAAGGGLALIQARRLTASLAALVAASARLGQADSSAQAGRYGGLQEMDVVADR
jgi:hypothetical protein